MVLYNLTIAVEPQQSNEWLDYMRSEHIPKIMATGWFINYRICQIPPSGDAEMAFAVQYTAPTEAHFRRYEAEFAAKLRGEYQGRFGQSTGLFRTILKIIDEGSVPMRDL